MKRFKGISKNLRVVTSDPMERARPSMRMARGKKLR